MAGHGCIANPCPLCAPPHTGGAPSGEWLAGWRACQEAAALVADGVVEEYRSGKTTMVWTGEVAAQRIRALQPTPDPTPSSGGGAMEWEPANRPPSDRKTWTSVFWPTMPSDFPQGYLIAPFPSGHQVYVDRLCPEGWEMRCLKLGCPDVITGKVTDVWDTDRLLKALADGRVIGTFRNGRATTMGSPIESSEALAATPSRQKEE